MQHYEVWIIIDICILTYLTVIVLTVSISILQCTPSLSPKLPLMTTENLQLTLKSCGLTYIYLRVWWEKPKPFNKVGWKQLLGIWAAFMGQICLMMYFPLLVWVIGHMKETDQKQGYQFLHWQLLQQSTKQPHKFLHLLLWEEKEGWIIVIVLIFILNNNDE